MFGGEACIHNVRKMEVINWEVEMAEAAAFGFGLEIAKRLGGYLNIWIEGDALKVVKLVKENTNSVPNLCTHHSVSTRVQFLLYISCKKSS